MKDRHRRIEIRTDTDAPFIKDPFPQMLHTIHSESHKLKSKVGMKSTRPARSYTVQGILPDAEGYSKYSYSNG